MASDEYLTVADIAARLQVNIQTVRNWIDADKLPAVRAGRRVRVRASDLQGFLTPTNVKPEAETDRRRDEDHHPDDSERDTQRTLTTLAG